jgi:L-cystine uptake protein TcyP (sodium:dicarboxylate symporter family)
MVNEFAVPLTDSLKLTVIFVVLETPVALLVGVVVVTDAGLSTVKVNTGDRELQSRQRCGSPTGAPRNLSTFPLPVGQASRR